MAVIRILTETDLRQIIDLDGALIECIENAFNQLATSDVIMPPVLSFKITEYNGEVDVKTAYVPGIDSFAIKISPGFFDNPKLGLPSLNGMMIVFSAKTGLVEAVLLDNGYLTDIRTAAAGAVAAKWLARRDASAAGIVGAGVQAGLQLAALKLVRNIRTAYLWARDPEKRRSRAAKIAQDTGINVIPVDSVDAVMERAEIIVTTTPSEQPLISATQVRPGQHITAMGSVGEISAPNNRQYVYPIGFCVISKIK